MGAGPSLADARANGKNEFERLSDKQFDIRQKEVTIKAQDRLARQGCSFYLTVFLYYQASLRYQRGGREVLDWAELGEQHR